jgi:Protein of unknown function (DUF5818)
MKRLLSIVALLGMSGLGVTLSAQQTQSTPADQGSTAQQQQPTDAANPQQTARSFQGKIAKSGDQLVLQEDATQTAYKLDDQDKAKQFEGKNVKVMATMDTTTNTLHVVDITPSENR